MEFLMSYSFGEHCKLFVTRRIINQKEESSMKKRVCIDIFRQYRNKKTCGNIQEPLGTSLFLSLSFKIILFQQSFSDASSERQ